MKTPQKFLLLSVMSGIVSGIVVTVAFIYLTQTQEPSINAIKTSVDNESSKPQQAVVASDVLAEANRRQLQQNHTQLLALERRVNELALFNNSDANTVADEDPVPAEENISAEEAKAADLQWWQDTKAEFEQERIDPKWANATNQLFETDLNQLAQESGFWMLDTECRSTKCSAVVEWPSFSDAQLAFADLLHYPYEANCARHTLLPEPDEADIEAPYEVTVIFDCSEWRNQGSIASSFVD